MSDSIPPQSPPPSAGTTPPTASATALVVRNAAVITAPVTAQPAAGQTSTPAPLRASVINDTTLPADQMRLRTDTGDIVVRTPHRLPADTEVLVDLHRQQTALLATIRLAARSADMQPPAPAPQSQPAAPTAPQPPALPPAQAGDTLVAVVLSGSLPQPPAPPPPLTADQAALLRQIALQLLASGGAAKAPLPLSVLTGLTASADPAAFIKTLPPEHNSALRGLLPPPAMDDTPAPAQPASLTAPVAEDTDNGLLTVLKALTSARLTQQAMTLAPPTGASAQTALIKSLFPLLEGLQSQGLNPARPQPAPSLTPQMQGAPAPMPPASAGASLKIISITPPPSATATAIFSPAPLPAQGAPATATIPPLPQPAAGQISGEVIGQTRDGMAVIKTPVADFVLSLRATLPTGTRLILEATPLTLADLATRMAAAGTTDIPDFFSFNPLGDRSWPALDEALALLVQSRPDAANLLTNTLPQPGPRMVPTTLFFMAALRLGMVDNWVGPQTLQTLRDIGGRTTADKLGNDFSRIARQSTEPLGGEWRGLSLPLMHDNQLSNIQLFVRRQNDDSDQATRGGKTTRFIVNLTLSRMGGMQLDGLMHEATPTAPTVPKRLDMIIRTDERLPPALMQELQGAYALGMNDSQITGSLQFQAKRQGWVEIDHASHDQRDV